MYSPLNSMGYWTINKFIIIISIIIIISYLLSKLVKFLVALVCLPVCLWATLLKKVWTGCNEIFGGDQVGKMNNWLNFDGDLGLRWVNEQQTP